MSITNKSTARLPDNRRSWLDKGMFGLAFAYPFWDVPDAWATKPPADQPTAVDGRTDQPDGRDGGPPGRYRLVLPVIDRWRSSGNRRMTTKTLRLLSNTTIRLLRRPAGTNRAPGVSDPAKGRWRAERGPRDHG